MLNAEERAAALDIEDKTYQPSVEELITFVGLPLFAELYDEMQRNYQPRCSVEYSGDKLLLGWNLKFKKAGKTLCTAYPRRKHFHLLLVIGRKEKPSVEALLPQLSEAFQQAYANTREGMGQRWMVLDFTERTALYEDVLKIVRIRRESK